jgi:hypothetical protein
VTKKVVGVFVRFRAPLRGIYSFVGAGVWDQDTSGEMDHSPRIALLNKPPSDVYVHQPCYWVSHRRFYNAWKLGIEMQMHCV